jgi:hypothetical protein
LAGVVVVLTVTFGPVDEPVTVAPTTTRAETRVLEVAPPSIAGIDPAVQRVLYASGKAEAMADVDMSQLPPEVARILAYYGATLAIPTDPRVDR